MCNVNNIPYHYIKDIGFLDKLKDYIDNYFENIMEKFFKSDDLKQIFLSADFELSCCEFNEYDISKSKSIINQWYAI